ncbi:MAG: biopolymer transporter ExbD [Planctomycetes bacterium]|nr:biopolymer transporter ExbD [Planctomycetota bacterium]
MAASLLLEPHVDEADHGPIVLRSRIRSDAELDMTPMIDCVFLLLIYFLVATRPDAATAITLPAAQFGSAVSAKRATILTVVDQGGGGALVYLADGKKGSPLAGNEEQQAAVIRDAVQEGLRSGKPNVLIKAERKTPHREVARIARAATQVGGVTLDLAVMDTRERAGGGP